MRRLTARPLLAAAIGASLLLAAACSPSESGTDNNTSAEASPTVDGSQVAFETIEDGRFTVGSTLSYPPLEMLVDGEPTGFEVELVEAIAADLGQEVEWVKVDFSGIIPGVAAEKFDFAASGVTGWVPPDSAARFALQPRLEQVGLTRPYFLYPTAFVTNSETHPGITSADDLESGMTVALSAGGTTIHEWAMDQLLDRGIEIQLMKDSTQLYTALSSGVVDATIDARTAADKAAEAYDNIFVGDNIPALLGGYCLAVGPDNPALLQALNESLTRLIDDGTWERLFREYFPDLELPDLPSEPLTLEDVQG